MSLETRIQALRDAIADFLGDGLSNATLLPLLDAVEEAAVQDEDFEEPADREARKARDAMRYEAELAERMCPARDALEQRERDAREMVRDMANKVMAQVMANGASDTSLFIGLTEALENGKSKG